MGLISSFSVHLPGPPSVVHLDLRFFRDCDGRLSTWLAHGGYCIHGVDGRSCPRGQLGDSGSGLLSFPYWVTLQPLSIDLTGPRFSHLYSEGLDT